MRALSIRFQAQTAGAGSWDADRLTQVVSNLVGNAIQHGLPHAPIGVVLAMRERGLALEVSIANRDGPVPADQRTRGWIRMSRREGNRRRKIAKPLDAFRNHRLSRFVFSPVSLSQPPPSTTGDKTSCSPCGPPKNKTVALAALTPPSGQNVKLAPVQVISFRRAQRFRSSMPPRRCAGRNQRLIPELDRANNKYRR